ncbi:uncharacterized protein LOC113447974 [Pseudonaja textilis]|uniref:uncharacterized protein LOC113447974 n=1 Tax=Pseudonaja textilis TaxID=8673 RepID=UPI000EAAC0B6|nr:uncharacterized protein LOC113447974 [Pseudonaja textilis]
MHQMCFCCQHCRRNLSMLNYAVFQGAFYCKVCSKLVAEVRGKRGPNSTLSPNHQQLPLKGTQSNPRQESQTKSGSAGRILAREKMPKRPSDLHLQGNQSDKVTSQGKPKALCSPLKKDAKSYTGRKHEQYGIKETQDSTVILRSPQRSDRSYYKTWEDNFIPESLGEQKSQLPRVIGPKCRDRVLHWIKKGHGNQELGALENRQLFVDEGIVGVQVGKTGPSLLEKARRFQTSTSGVERSTSKVTSLSLNLARSSLGGTFLSSEGALRHTTVTPAATTRGAPQLAKDCFQGDLQPGGDSSWKVTSDGKNPRQVVKPLPKIRTTLPGLVPPLEQRSKKKLQKASQKNTPDTLESKDAEEPSDGTMVSMQNEEPSQSKPEGLVSSPGHEEKKNNHSKKTFNVDPVKPCLETNQEPKPSWMTRNEFLEEETEILQPEKRPSMDDQLSPETLPLSKEDKKDEMHPRAISDKFATLTCFPVSLDTGAKGRTSSSAKAGNIEDGDSLPSLQADDVENGEVLPRNSLQEHATLICNPEPTPEITNTNGKLQANASSGLHLELAFQEDTSRDISFLPSAKDPEILPSCEVLDLIEKEETGHVTMETKAQHESVPATNQDITAEPSKKQSLKKQNNPFAQFFAPKTQRSIPSQKPISGTKKAAKTHSALLTLFGHSDSKDKSQKEKPRKELGELSGKVDLQPTHFLSLSKPDFSKKDENSGMALKTRNSEADPQDSKESHGIGSKGNQNRNSPPLDSVNTVFLDLGREISTTTQMQPRSKPLDVLRQSNINAEHTVEDPEKSLALTSFQSCVASTENASQYSANTLVETSVSCRNVISEQESNDVDSQDLEIKARNVSLLHPLAKDETQALDEEIGVPDMVSSFKGMEESASTEKENAESSSGSDTEFVHVKDHFCSENFLGISHPQFAELEPIMVIREDSLRNNQPPESGNFQALESDSDNPFKPTLHIEEAANENYSIKENHFHPVLIPAQSMPELLRDTLQSKATERSHKSPPEDKIQVLESRHPQEQLQ